jgi:hypothetical protein
MSFYTSYRKKSYFFFWNIFLIYNIWTTRALQECFTFIIIKKLILYFKISLNQILIYFIFAMTSAIISQLFMKFQKIECNKNVVTFGQNFITFCLFVLIWNRNELKSKLYNIYWWDFVLNLILKTYCNWKYCEEVSNFLIFCWEK